MLVVSTGNGSVHVVEADTLETRRVVDTQFTPAALLPTRGAVPTLVDRCVSVATDGTLLAMKDTESSFSTWDVATGVRRRQFHGHDWQAPCECNWHALACAVVGHRGAIAGLAVNVGAGVVASVDEEAEVYVWSLQAGVALHRLRYCLQGLPLVLSFAPDGSTLVVGDANGDVAAYVDTSRASAARPCIYNAHVPDTPDPDAERCQVLALTWCNTSEKYYCGYQDGMVVAVPSPKTRCKSAPVERASKFLEEGAGCVCSLAVSPDGLYLAVAGSSGYYETASAGVLGVYNVRTADEVWTQRVQGGVSYGQPLGADLLCVAFSPDSTTVFAGSVDGKLRAWGVQDGELLRTVVVPSAILTVVSCFDVETHSRQQRQLALAMGLHDRLGGSSLLNTLTGDVVRELGLLIT